MALNELPAWVQLDNVQLFGLNAYNAYYFYFLFFNWNTPEFTVLLCS